MKTTDRQVQEFLFPEMSASARLDALIEARAAESLDAIAAAGKEARELINRRAAQSFRRIRERCR